VFTYFQLGKNHNTLVYVAPLCRVNDCMSETDSVKTRIAVVWCIAVGFNDLLVHKDGTCTCTSDIGMENLGRLSWAFQAMAV
jgi:hypothetical protein